MSAQRDFDTLLRSWFDESAPSGQPEGLLEAVLGTTSHTRPRPAWLVRLGGEPMLEQSRSGLNRIAPLALAAGVLVVTLLIAYSLLVRPPNVGPPSTPPPDPSHSAASVGDSPFVGGTHWEIVSLDTTPIPPPDALDRYYLAFSEDADTVLFDPGCGEVELAVSLDPHGSAIRFATRRDVPLCGTVDYIQVNQQIVRALEGVERWQPAGAAFDLIGTGGTIRVRVVDCAPASPGPVNPPGDVELDCSS